ncbi:MAG: stressosome-associated protein Prli42 [Bacillaceae bacterium]|nr:stressosome-associated protein Prli42 [Bacillaceae bacterium]
MLVAKKKNNPNQTSYTRPSKRKRRFRVIIYLMILSMLLSSILAGAVMFL